MVTPISAWGRPITHTSHSFSQGEECRVAYKWTIRPYASSTLLVHRRLAEIRMREDHVHQVFLVIFRFIATTEHRISSVTFGANHAGTLSSPLCQSYHRPRRRHSGAPQANLESRAADRGGPCTRRGFGSWVPLRGPGMTKL